MATIEMTLALNDEMSNGLDVIISKSKQLYKALEPIREVRTDYSSFKQMGTAVEDVTEALTGKTKIVDDVKGSIGGLGESVRETTEKITELGKTAGGTSEQLGGLNDALNLNGRGMSFMTMGTARLLGGMGLMPRAASSAVIGLNQLNRGLGTTALSLSAVTAKIAPLLLLSTAVFGIVGAVRNLGRESDSVDDVYRSFSSLNSETNRLTQNLNTSVDLFERLKGFGADTSILDRLAAENIMLETMITNTQTQAALMARDTGQAIKDSFLGVNRELRRVGGEIGYIFDGYGGVTESLRPVMEVVEWTNLQSLSSFADVLEAGGKLYENQKAYLMAFFGSAGETMQSIINAGMGEYDFAKEITRIVGVVNEYYSGLRTFSDAIDGYEKSIEAAAAATINWGDSARGANRAVRDLQRGFGRFGSIVDGVTDAWYAMNSAMNGATFGYGNAIDAFEAMYNIGYQNIHMLFDNYGALLDVEDAINKVYAAQIQMKAFSMADSLIAQAEAAALAAYGMDGYTYATDLCTEAMIRLRLESAKALGIVDQVHAIFGMAEQATLTALAGGRGGGSRLPLTSRGAVRAGIDEPIEIKGENLRMLIDAAERRRAEALRPISLSVDSSIHNPTFYNTEDFEETYNRITHKFVKDVYDSYYANART